MRILLCFLATLGSCFVAVVAQETTPSDISVIRQSVDAYVAAYNAGDAKALAALWSEQGELISSDGSRWEGHQQLEQLFAADFSTTPGSKIEISEVEIELLSPRIAIETGVARVVDPNGEPSDTKYRAVHLKTPEGWRIESVKEAEVPLPPPSHYEHLQDLSWLVGQWASGAGDTQIETSCRWSSNQNFLVQTFKILVAGSVDFEGTQIIGWDPTLKSVRSWTFDSDGGFGVGRWSGGEGRWTAKILHTLPDGRRGSATNIYEIVDDDSVRYQSIGRQVDGELMPSVGPVTIARSNN